MIGKLLLGFWILRWISLAGSLAEAVPLDESLDEMNDAEIFRAVLVSMRQWALHKRAHQRAKRELSKVCYEDVGCFEDTGPFSYLEMLPSPPKDVGTRFLVYGSRKARSIPMEVPADDIGDGAHRAIDPDLPTKVIVHGFGSSCDHVWVYEMRSALMAVHDCNIVCVDWGPGSAVPNYVRAAANTRLVGRQLAKLIRSLNVPLEKVHLIGFSLGAHVAGFAGAELGNVSRITGLDPAGPLFESQDPRARLDETDANFVDVIHSNGEQLLLGGLGSWQPMGDVDFYPNGGRMQTGCSNIFVGAVSDIIWSSAVEGRSLCNHRRAYKLFTDSVSPRCRFPAFPCETGFDGLLRGECFPCGGPERPCGDMGYYSDESPARGQLYLVTRDEEPFCAHQFQVKVYNSRGERPTKSYGRLQVTLVGEGLFNDTFSMTRKDEELLVGATLQKIVVPHPAISNLEGIEVRYTAYNGWLSSGLDSWSIDKVSVVDSFGKALSVCRKGLSLVSGRASYLPLYPGECNVPAEAENSTLPVLERLVDQSVGIGPFTREENFKERPMEFKDRSSELKDRVQDFKDQSTEFSDRPVEFGDRSTEFKERLTEFKDRAPEFKDAVTSKGLGPYTKEENLRILESFRSKVNEETRRPSNPWTIQDLSDGESNSLEGGDLETGRGFSNFIPRSEPATEYPSEIREPVLRTVKKEAGSGRSLKLPEITEPILRPRPTRQNGEDSQGQDSGSRTRSFTVQFLPERLAGILAQAERYARQTLLPLISQYTPSFVAGPRLDQPRYFPPLGEVERSEYMEGGGSVVETSGGYRFLEESNRTFESETDDGQPGDGREDYGGHAGHENHGGHGGREGYGGPGGDAGDAGRVSYEGREDHRGLGGSEGHAGHGGREDHEGHGGVENPEGSEDHEASGEPGQDTNTEFSEGAGQAGTPEDAAGPAQFRLNQGQGQGRDQPPLQLPWTPSQLESDWQPISEAPRRDPNGSRSLDFDQPNHANSGSLSDLNLSLERSNSDAIAPGGQLNGSRSLDLGKVDLASRSSEAASVDAIAGKDESATWSKKVQGATEPADESNVGWLENGAVTLDEEDWVPITPETKTAEVETPPSSPDRKYIPLSQPEVSTKPSDTEEPSSTAYSHIQRIPKVIGHQPVTLRRSMMFPYAYERKKDPRTRYIPLIPEEDFGRSPLLLEKER